MLNEVSNTYIISAMITVAMATTIELFCRSDQLGQVTFSKSSTIASLKYENILFIYFFSARVERLELPANGFGDHYSTNWATPVSMIFLSQTAVSNYFSMEVIWPAPTVLPPSRIANLKPSLIATGEISSTVIVKLSPGMTISVPSGRIISPVTSVVLK